MHVTSFTKPSAIELAHDYLWRVNQNVPGKGEIGICNRSHYEDVLVVRVNSLAPEAVWSKRFAHIVAFEIMLADEGINVARRTVAKYREAMKIPSSSERKVRKPK